MPSSYFKLIGDPFLQSGDVTPPTVNNVQPSGAIDPTSAVISAYYSDTGSGINTSSVNVTLDGNTLNGCNVSTNSVSCPVTSLAYGSHTIGGSVADNSGNVSPISGGFIVCPVCPSGANSVALQSHVTITYYPSFMDYMNQMLNVDITLTNNSGINLNFLEVDNILATNGVSYSGGYTYHLQNGGSGNSPSIPFTIGNLANGSSQALTLTYYVDEGGPLQYTLPNFLTSICGSAKDGNGSAYDVGINGIDIIVPPPPA